MNFLQQLTEKERAFFKCLEDVDSESLWGLAISNVVKNPDVPKFRGLISSLKSQAKDCEVVMVDVLGQQCYYNLLNL